MKKFKQIISVVLCAVLCCSVSAVGVSAKSVKKYVNSISVAKKAAITIPASKSSVTKKYKVTVKVVNKASKAFTAKSSNKAVAAVKVSGSYVSVTAKKSGVAKITVTTKAKNSKGKKLSKVLTLTVTKKQPVTPLPVVDEREGEITAKAVPWYMFNPVNSQILSGNDTVYFSSAYPDVPFLDDTFVIQYFLQSYMWSPDCEVVKSEKGLSHKYNLPMGTSVTFDYDNKLMIFSDYTSTLRYKGDGNNEYLVFNPFGSVFPTQSQSPGYKVSEKDVYHGGDPIVATYGYDEVPMLRDGDKILIPLQAFSDLFFSNTGSFYSYNGKGVFYIDNALASTPSKKEYYELYKDSAKTDTISEALAQVNYYELCNALDARYGLQAAHNISSFDEYFTRMGIRDRMLSTDLKTVQKAQIEISTMLFEDFHSSSGMPSVFLNDFEDYTPQASPVYTNRRAKMQRLKATRTASMGEFGKDFSAYERRGDTVFITFDQFDLDLSFDTYTADGFEPTANPDDTVELFAFALKRLQNEDSDAKNVVIDLACNGGGAVLAGGYAMQAICGQCNINVQNPNTWALHQCVLDFDLNFDGKYDENDKSMLDLGFNVAVNISDHSFSCANLLPNALDQLDDRILFIGQQSGGGACAVGYLSTAIGSTMQISSENRFVTMKNGYIRDIDGGLAPDVNLTLNRIFDRDYIVNVVNDKFGN